MEAIAITRIDLAWCDPKLGTRYLLLKVSVSYG